MNPQFQLVCHNEFGVANLDGAVQGCKYRSINPIQDKRRLTE
jgi:hypothetical protein